MPLINAGELRHDPGYGYIGCATRWFDKTIISFNTTDAAVYLRFDMPDVDAWSFGFVYHADAENQDYNVTYLYKQAAGQVFATHAIIDDGRWRTTANERVRPQQIHSGSGGANVLVFRTSEDGAFLRLNDAVVLDIPASDLARQNGFAEMCVGFRTAEDEHYTLRYGDLRDEWARKNHSGSIFHDGEAAEFVGCNQLVLSSRTNHAWTLFDFVVPSVSNWSIGIFYHENIRRGAVTSTALGMRGSEAFYSHRNILRGETHGESTYENFERSLFNRGRNASNTVEFEVDDTGFWLRLNGERVIEIPADQLTPYPGRIEICTGHFIDETERYQIRYGNLWAWVE